jgi:hypothetical protein
MSVTRKYLKLLAMVTKLLPDDHTSIENHSIANHSIANIDLSRILSIIGSLCEPNKIFNRLMLAKLAIYQ